MHTVIETPTFLRDCDDAELSDDERLAIVNAIAAEPKLGDLMPGTGGLASVVSGATGKENRGAIGL